MNNLIYIGDFTQEFKTAPREKYQTVQHYAYSSLRSRNDAGFPHGPALTTIMDFTIRLQLPANSKVFHKRMHDNNAYPYSFIFDPEFNPSGKKILKNYVSAMVVVGNVIDVEETFDAQPDNKGNSKQMEVHVKLLVKDITYIGVNQSKKLVLMQDPPEPVTNEPNAGSGDGGGDSNDGGKTQTSKEEPKAFAKYALYIGRSAQAVGVDEGITHLAGQRLTSSNGIAVNVLLNSLSYHKKIYQPNEITAKLSVTWSANDSRPSYKTLQDIFLFKQAELKVVDENIDQIIAKNYYVYQLRPHYRKMSQCSCIDLELQMFSLDKLATLDKFSKAYTAKKLGADIFTPELATFKEGDMNLEGSATNLQFLGIGSDELRIPYAVQYNETFYDFIKRLANRYGEFLFFENGQLNLGLNPGTSNYFQKAADGTDTTSLINWAEDHRLQSLTYQHLDEKAIDVDDQQNNYLDREDEETVVYVSDEDSKGNKLTKFFNPDSVAADENLYKVNEDGDITMADQYEEFRKFIVQDLLAILSGNSLAQMLADLVTTETFRVMKAGVKTADKIGKFNKNHYDDYSKKDGFRSDNSVMHFASINGNSALATKLGDDTVVNLSSKFYSLVREMEQEVTKEAVTLEFGEFTRPFSLGDRIQVDGTDYIVVDIEGQADMNEDGFTDFQQVTGIPLYNRGNETEPTYVVVPPLQPDIQLCEAKPQRAFIDSTKDPFGLGRVRVRYPWQVKKDKKGDVVGDATPWIRVALPMAANGGSVNFSPENGDEAMIGYENGNIERPYVIGYLASPYVTHNWGDAIPNRGIVSVNGHSLTFDDGGDGMNFFWGWLPIIDTVKGFIPGIDWPDELKATNPRVSNLTGGITLTDRYGLYEISASSDGRNVSVKSPMGDVKISAFTGIKVAAPNGDISITGKNVSITAGDKLTLKSGENMKKTIINESDKFGWDSGQWFAADFGLGLLNNFSSRLVESMIDFTLLRTVLEVFARPVDGTLKIKSNTHVMVEAGKGSVQVPKGFYKKAPKDALTEDEMKYQAAVFVAVKNTVNMISENVNGIVESIRTAYNAYRTSYTNYQLFLERKHDRDGNILPFDKIRSRAYSANLTDDINTINIEDVDFNMNASEMVKIPDLREEPQPPSQAELDNLSSDQERTAARTAYNTDHLKWVGEDRAHTDAVNKQAEWVRDYKLQGKNIIVAIFNLRKAYNILPGTQYNSATMVKGIADKVLDLFEMARCPLTRKNVNEEKIDNIPDFSLWESEKKYIKRKIVYEMMTSDNATFKATINAGTAEQDMKIKDFFKVRPEAKVTDFKSDAQWKYFVRNIFVDDRRRAYAKEWAAEHLGQPFKDFYDMFAHNRIWNPDAKGRILFSDQPAKTISFSKSKDLTADNNIETLTTQHSTEISRVLGEL